jgi:hypothetical protein
MYKKIILVIIILILALVLMPAKATTEPQGQSTEEPSLQLPPEKETTREAEVTKQPTYYTEAVEGLSDAKTYKAELRAIATTKGLSEAKIAEIEVVIGGNGENRVCPTGESNWNPTAVGDKGTSFGLVQIHLPAHPHITEAQARNPEFALNFIVDEFIRGNEWKWTCWKAVYKNG